MFIDKFVIWWYRMNISEQGASTWCNQVGQSTHDSPETISKDAAFHLLQNSRRRAVLRYLIDNDDDVYSMREVTEQVAAWENDTTIAELTSNERQRVYIALYQSHLPKLNETNIIEYNRDRGTLAPTPLLFVLEPYLDKEHESVLIAK
jgi:putative lipase involved disintegration of autophagic bodies